MVQVVLLRPFAQKGILCDLTQNIVADEKYDFVYSIGLIEHFDYEEREICESCGKVISVEINKKLFLTQMLVLCTNEIMGI